MYSSLKLGGLRCILKISAIAILFFGTYLKPDNRNRVSKCGCSDTQYMPWAHHGLFRIYQRSSGLISVCCFVILILNNIIIQQSNHTIGKIDSLQSPHFK